MLECTQKRYGDMLYAYELDMLQETDADAVQIHLLECEHCLQLAQQYERAARTLRHDSDVRRIVSSLCDAEAPQNALPARHVMVQRYLLVAVLVLALGIPVYRMAFMDDGESGPVQELNLVPVRGADTDPILLELDGAVEIRFYVKGATSEEEYRVTIRAADDGIVFSDKKFSAFSPPGSGLIILPTRSFDTGLYRLEVYDSTGTQLAYYAFMAQ